MKSKHLLIGASLLLSFAAQAAVVQWDGSSTDITSLSANVNATAAGGVLWTDAQKAWDTTDLAMAAQGDQAAIKLALSQTQQTHKTAQINHGTDSLFVGGGGSAVQLKIDITPGFSTIYAFDTGVFDATDTLTNLSVTVYEREASDVCSFRWFVVSDGTPYVSASVAADVGTTKTDYTLADPASETWYAFDGSTNLEAAVGASVGTLTLTNVTYAGIMGTVDAITNPDKNWRGVYLYKFFAETDGDVPNEAPVADAQSVIVEKNSSVVITLTGSDPEGSSLTYSVDTLPNHGILTGTAPNLTYTPDTDYTGADSFTFTVNDGETNSEPATVSIAVKLTGATWDDGGADDFWSNPTNWVGDVLPVSGGSNVIFNTGAVNENVVMDSDFTVGSGQTLINYTEGGNLVFRIGDMGASGELRFAAGSTLDFDYNGFITESGSVNQRLTFEPGATLSAWRYYANNGFTTTFEASETGISTFHTTDSTGGNSLRCRGDLVVDLTSYTNGTADLVLFTYTAKTTDEFSSITVTDSSGTLVEGEDYGITYDANLGDGVRSVVLSVYRGGLWENDMSTDPAGDGWDIRDDRDGHYVTNGVMVMPAGGASTSTIDTMPVNTFPGITEVDLQWRATTPDVDGNGRGACLFIVVDAEGTDAGAINFHAVKNVDDTQTFRIFNAGTQIDEVTGFSTNMLTLSASIDGYLDTIDYVIGDGTTSVIGSVGFVQYANTGVGSVASLLTFAPEMEVDYIRIETGVASDAAYVLAEPAAVVLTDVPKTAAPVFEIDAVCNASTNLDLTIMISDESHAGAFSVLSDPNPTVTPPDTLALYFEFDPTAGGLAYEATATGLVTIAWSEQGGGDSGQVIVPVSATVASTPVLAWDGYENLQTANRIFNATNAAETVWNTSTADLEFGYPRITSAFSSVSDGTANYRAQYQLRGSANPDELWIRGGGDLVPSRYVTLVGMDASSLGDPELMADALYVEIREERAADTTTFRWFVEANGNAYVSAEVAELTTTFTNISLDNATAIEWFSFDGAANVADAVGASVGMSSLSDMAFTNINAVGVYVDAVFTTTAAWHGSRIKVLSLTTALSAYSTWAASYGLYGAEADMKADVENGGLGDGLDNLMEYALGGDPTVDDAATVAPGTYMAEDGGSDWFYHVYNERTDDASLTFAVGATPNLVTTPADPLEVEFVGESVESGGFKSVTNRTEATTDAKFIQLEVSQ